MDQELNNTRSGLTESERDIPKGDDLCIYQTTSPKTEGGTVGIPQTEAAAEKERKGITSPCEDRHKNPTSLGASSATAGMSSLTFAFFLNRPLIRMEIRRATFASLVLFSVGFSSALVSCFSASSREPVSVFIRPSSTAGIG